jgi:hypothetical protein
MDDDGRGDGEFDLLFGDRSGHHKTLSFLSYPIIPREKEKRRALTLLLI